MSFYMLWLAAKYAYTLWNPMVKAYSSLICMGCFLSLPKICTVFSFSPSTCFWFVFVLFFVCFLSLLLYQIQLMNFDVVTCKPAQYAYTLWNHMVKAYSSPICTGCFLILPKICTISSFLPFHLVFVSTFIPDPSHELLHVVQPNMPIGTLWNPMVKAYSSLICMGCFLAWPEKRKHTICTRCFLCSTRPLTFLSLFSLFIPDPAYELLHVVTCSPVCLYTMKPHGQSLQFTDMYGVFPGLTRKEKTHNLH